MKRLLMPLVSAAMKFIAPPVLAGDTPQKGSAFDFGFRAIDGKPIPLAAFKGRVLLVVNTASFCGFTQQYEGLQALSEKYKAAGLTVIGVPSNDFGGQEPKAEAEIKTFCEGAFGVTFPLAGKNVVKGEAAHPFYKWAVSALGSGSAPRWNFHKFLIGRDGRAVASFGTGVEPQAKEIIAAIEKELAKAAAIN